MAFLVFPSSGSVQQSRTASPVSPMGAFAGTPNELSPEEIPYEMLLGIHRATLLPDSTIGPRHRPTDEVSEARTDVNEQRSPAAVVSAITPLSDAALAAVARRRRSALDFDPATTPMQLQELEQLLDFATRDWRADWRGNFHGNSRLRARGMDFVVLYLYVHRVSGCDPGVYRWNRSSQTLEQLHRGNLARVATYLSLEQTLAGNACFAVSMVADLERAARAFGNRGYRYVFFEAGAIGQRLYLGAEALRWSATGIGAFYDDDVHRYLGFLEDKLDGGEESVRDSLDRAERLPQQVIYHFAVGRAVPDPRLEA
jgi:SagB-type dehydrogenase family enzyme